MRRVSLALRILLLTLIGFGNDGIVRAQFGAAPTTANRQQVEVLVAGPADDAHALQASLRELLDRLALDLRMIQVEAPNAEIALHEPAPGVVARFSADLRVADTITVMMLDNTASSTMTRSVARRGSRALQIEETAYIIHVATESKLAGAVGRDESGALVTRSAEPQHPSSEDSASGRSPSSGAARIWRVDLATFALAGTVAKDAGAVFGGGIAAELAARERWFPQAWLLGAYHLPFGNDELPVEVRTAVWSLRTAFTLALIQTPRFSLQIGAGAGADLFLLSPGPSSNFARVNARRLDVSPVAQALAIARLSLRGSSSLFLGTTLDLDITPRAYVMTIGRETSDLIRPDRVRPSVLVGFCFSLLETGNE